MRARVFGAVTIAVTLAVILRPVYQFTTDEGQILAGAWNLYNGKMLYRDFFEFIPPGSFYLTYGSFLLLGPQYSSALFASVLLQLVSAYFLYLLAKKFLSQHWAYAAVLAWIFLSSISYPAINHNSHSAYLAVVFTYLFLRFLKTQKIFFAFGSGALAGITFYFLQTKGLALALFGLIFLLIASPKDNQKLGGLFSYLAGGLSMFSLGTLLWKLSPITTLREVSFGNLAINYLTFTFFPLAIFLILFLAAFGALLFVKKINQEILLLVFLQGALMLSVLNNPTSYHIWLNSFGAIILFFVLLEILWKKMNHSFVIRTTPCLALLLFTVLVFIKISLNTLKTLYALNGLGAIKKIVGKEKIFAFPFIPNFYFELQKPNPYYNSILLKKNNPESHFVKNLEILQNEKPRYILTNYAIVEKYGHTFSNPIDTYIRKNYSVIKKIGDVKIWEKNLGD